MKRVVLSVLAIASVLTCAPSWAQENRLRVMQPTKQLLRENRSEEALAKLVQAAEQATDNEDQAYYLGEAIGIARSRLKDPDRALTMAMQIRDSAHSQNQQMALLAAEKAWVAITERFGKTDLATWPDTCRQQAYLTRAQAWLKCGDNARAEADLKQAIEAPGDKATCGRACQLLGSLYRTAYQDSDRALAIYDRALALTESSYAWRCECFLDRISILLEQNRLEEAEQAFAAVDFRAMSTDHWRNAFYQSYATVLERRGKHGSAATQLTHVLRFGGLSEAGKQQIQARLDRLIDNLWEEGTSE